MKTIVIGRHAKSDWSLGLPDFERPLNKRGRRDAPRMGALLARQEFMPDLIVSSPAVRALTTAQMIAKELGYSAAIREEQSIYDYGHGACVSILQDLPDEVGTVMLFGHNPTMENLIEYFLQMRSGVIMPTCALACIEAPQARWADLNPLSMHLKWLLIPKIAVG